MIFQFSLNCASSINHLYLNRVRANPEPKPNPSPCGSGRRGKRKEDKSRC